MTQNNEREAVVRFARDVADDWSRWPVTQAAIAVLADAIQRGDHLENTNDTN